MDKLKKILDYAKSSNGTFKSSDLKKINIHRQYLSVAYNKGLFEKVSRGIYILKDNFEDKLYAEQLLVKKLIYSHSTSAYYLELTTRDPLQIYGCVPKNYSNANFSKKKNLIIKRVSKDEVYELGITEIKNEYGNYIKIYNAEKTVCDLIKSKKDIDPAIFSEVLNNYFKRHKKDIRLLIKYAKIMKIEEEVRKYTEVMIWNQQHN